MSVPTNRSAYKRHQYSGPRKSGKKIQAGLKRGNKLSRLAWRKENLKMGQKELEQTLSCLSRDREQALTDPIYLDVKTEPRSDVVDNTNETLALNEPTGTKRKARIIPRSDVTPTLQQTRGDSSTAAAASSVRLTEEVDESRNEKQRK